MLSGPLLDYRPGAADAKAVPATSTLGPAPTPVAVSAGESGWPFGRGAAGLMAAVAIHVVFAAAFVAIWRSMVTDVSVPDGIAVELVRSMPTPAPPVVKPPDPPPPKPPPPSAPEAAAPPPAAAAAPAPAKPPDPLAQALSSPLLEPPPEPKAAAAQAAVNQTGNSATATEAERKPAAGRRVPARPDQPKTPAAPAAVPGVLTTPKAETAVPAANKPSPSPAPDPPTPGDPSVTTPGDATARLNAALATASLPMPTSFRAALSAAGSSNDATYRGSVFGALSRARQGVEQAARTRHLTGQVVMAVVLTATGAIDTLSVVQSSGHSDADAFALDMVRRAAPFPPPPPGASRTFTPAISFGE